MKYKTEISLIEEHYQLLSALIPCSKQELAEGLERLLDMEEGEFKDEFRNALKDLNDNIQKCEIQFAQFKRARAILYS
jgi:hypothetical protein